MNLRELYLIAKKEIVSLLFIYLPAEAPSRSWGKIAQKALWPSDLFAGNQVPANFSHFSFEVRRIINPHSFCKVCGFELVSQISSAKHVTGLSSASTANNSLVIIYPLL